MQRQALYATIAVLVLVVAGFAVYAYQKEQEPSGISLEVNENGVSIETN